MRSKARRREFESIPCVFQCLEVHQVVIGLVSLHVMLSAYTACKELWRQGYPNPGCSRTHASGHTPDGRKQRKTRTIIPTLPAPPKNLRAKSRARGSRHPRMEDAYTDDYVLQKIVGENRRNMIGGRKTQRRYECQRKYPYIMPQVTGLVSKSIQLSERITILNP